MEGQKKRQKEENKENGGSLQLWEKILVRLDVKDLSRFKSVCRGWYGLISSPEFINRHWKLSKSDSAQYRHRILSINPFITIDYQVFGFHVESESWNKILDKWAVYPRALRGTFVEIMGSCDGLICLLRLKLEDERPAWNNKVIIWNPCTQDLVKIPLPFDGCLTGIHWFGRENSGSDDCYKVVLSDTRRIFELSSDNGVYAWSVCAEIPAEKMWLPKGEMQNRGTHLDGRIHWPIFQKRRIFSYNLSKRKLRGFLAPNAVKDGSPFTLEVFDGCLGAICKRKQNFEIWVMTEYGAKESWIRLMKLKGFADAKVLRTLGTLKNDDLIVDVDQKTLERYYFNGKTPRVVKTRHAYNGFSDSITFVESLASPTKCIKLAPKPKQ